METSIVQLAVATTTTTSLSPSGNDAPPSGDSFATTLGRALGAAPSPDGDMPSNSPQGAVRGRRSPRDSTPNDTSAMSGLLLGYFIPNQMPPTSPLTLTSNVTDPASPQSTNSAATPGASEPATGQSAETTPVPSGLAGGIPISPISGMVIENMVPATAGSGSSDVSQSSSGPTATSESDQARLAMLLEPTNIAPAPTPGIQELPAPTTSGPQPIAVLPPQTPDESSRSINTGPPHSPPIRQSAVSPPKGIEVSSNQGFGAPSGPPAPPVWSNESGTFKTPDLASSEPQKTAEPFGSQGSIASPGPNFLPTWSTDPETLRAQVFFSLAPAQNSQTLPVSTVPLPQIGQPQPESATPITDPPQGSSAFIRSDLPSISEFMAGFAIARVVVKAGDAQSPLTPMAGATVPCSSVALKPPASFPPLQTSSKIESLGGSPARWISPSTASSNAAASAATSQKAVEIEVASVSGPLPASQAFAPLQHFDMNAQLPTLQAGVHGEAASQANAERPSVTSPFISTDTAADANLSDQATGGQGNSGQPGGSSSSKNSAPVMPFSSIPANPVTVDPGTNLLTSHAPEIPASHHNLSTAPAIPAGSTQQSAMLGAWQNYEGGTGKVVRSAWLGESVNGAEMHVELRSSSLGPVEVHAVVHDGSVGAEIRVEGHEAHAILAAGLPSLERALGERDLRVGNIAVYQNHGGAGMGEGGRQNPHSDSPPTPQHQVANFDTPAQTSRPTSSAETENLANPAAGLNVRA